MRTVLTRSLLILGLLFGGAFNATATELPCNQSFSPLYLRYGAYHYLEDKVSNPNNFPLYAQSMYAEFSTLGYFVGGGKLDNPVLWDIPANANNLVLMRSEFPVHIANHPAVRSTDMVRGDIYAQYVMTWDILNTVTTADDTTHVECQPYIVTWCGDGVKDTQLDYMGVPYESCDDGAQNGQPGKCNATCSGTVPLTPVPGVCGTSNGQTLPSAPVTNLCAAGTPTAVTGAGPWTWSCTGLNGGVNSPICTANPLPPPVNGVCSSTVTGPQSSPLVNGACNLGTVIGFGSTGTNPVNYKWNCSGTNGGNNSPDCNASYTPPPPPVAGVCSSTVTGPQSSPLVNGACNVGGAINFVANGTNPALYTWNCSGSNGGPNSPNCTASYTPPPPPVNGVCSSTVTGPQSAPLLAGVCNAGTVAGFTSIGTNPVNYTWSCIGQNGGTNSSTCTASYTPLPPPVNGVCSSTVTGPQSSPLVTGACNAGSVVGFLASGTNPVNYSWTCGGINGGTNSSTCTANYTPPVTNFAVSIKKYVDTFDAQTISGAVVLNTGDSFDYILKVKNEGPAATSGITTVTDSLPSGVILNGAISAPGWICTGTTNISCASSSVIAANAFYSDITLHMKVTATGGTITNVGTVSNPGGSTPTGPTTDPGVIVVPPPPVCSTTYVGALPAPINATTPGLCNVGTSMTFMLFASGTTQNFTWSCKSGTQTVGCNAHYTPPVNHFAISIKKYVNTFDAQTVSGAVILNTGDSFDYILKVQNEGPDASVGTVTVTDVLPVGVVLDGPISAPGWTCVGTTTIICVNSNSIAGNSFFPDITLHMKVTATSGTITNIGSVSAPGCEVPVGPTTDPGVIVVAPPPVCDPGKIGVQLSPLTMGYCASGTATGFTAVGTNPINYSWSCKNVKNQSVTCNASYVPVPPPPPPKCSSTLSGALASPISNGACDSGTATGFTAVGTNPVNYSWSCKNAINESVTCNASYSTGSTASCNSISVSPTSGNIPLVSNVSCNTTNATTVTITCGNGQTLASSTGTCTYATVGTFTPTCTVDGTITNASCKGTVTTTNVTPPPSSYVSIKKYAGTLDGQDATGALQVVPGSSFNYRYDVSNTGTVAATGVVVTDTLPQYVTINSITKPAGWTCTQGTMTGGSIVYPTVVCSTPSLASGATVSITVNATLSLSTPANAQLRNIAYVCKQGDAPTVNCDPTCIVDPTNPRCNPPPPPPQCDPMPGSPHYDPACVVTPPSTNRSCDTLASLPSGSTLSPSVDVTYTCTATGAIAVPANLEYSIKCGAGDTSTGSTYTGSNTRVCRTPSTNSTSQTITCAVRDKSTGIVFSGSEIGACNVTKTTSGGSSTAMLYVPKCVNGNPTCATTGNYADTALCKIGEGRDCYTNQADCDVAKGSLSCGGGGCSGPNCGTCVGSSCSNGGGYCGDGVLQSGEECDVSGATWCGQRGERDYLGNLIECQIKGLTIPGDNPITDLWMTIPLLSHTRLGYTWLDTIGNTGKIRFNDNGMVLGVNTRAFTIADKVGFGIKREYNVPLTVEANKIVCLTSSGTSMNSNTACTNFGDLVPASMKFTVPATGQEYVLIGNGDYQVRQLDGTYRQYTVTGNPNNIDLFKGANTYVTSNGNMKLYEAFYGTNIGLDGQLALYHRSISTGEPIPLAALRVNVSGAKVGGTSSTVNRKLETYINSTSIVSIFLSGFQGYTTTTSSTNAVGGGSATAVNGGVTVSTTAAPPGGLIVLGAAIPASYRLNGNDNIYSVRGDVIMNCTSGITATELQGVRTLIVENGDLIINCNNGYGSSDISSSWAFIVKNGNIRVAKEVTNMAGIYVSIGTPGVTACDGTGNLCSLGNQATNNILRVNGSMYGNAKPLFDSRLYVRGTNAYDILTTGVIISYSNRALVNPPPLLSQYLNNYSVTRVVK